MELQEMKKIWEDMSQKVDQQKILTDKLIIDMTQNRFEKTLRKISVPETIGSIICFAMGIFVLLNFKKLDTWYFISSGVFTVAYLVVIPSLVLWTIHKMRHINIANSNYKQIIVEYSLAKKNFFSVQKISIYLGFILIITSMALSGKIISDKDIFIETNILYWYIPAMSIFLYLFSRWGFKHYSNAAQQAESLLNELDE